MDTWDELESVTGQAPVNQDVYRRKSFPDTSGMDQGRSSFIHESKKPRPA
jgi:hypothetical protein